MMRRILIVCLLSAGCFRAAEPTAVLRLGVIAPLSGKFHETVGRPAREAALLAVEQANERGGLDVGGRRYHLDVVFEDDQDRPEVAIQAARKLINQDGVAALVGPFLSHNALAVARVAENQGTPMISPTASHPDLTARGTYSFRVTLGEEVHSRELARFAYRELGARNAAALYDVASAYNRSFAEGFRTAFEQAGGRVSAFETYTAGEDDFRSTLARIRAAEPDVLLLPNYAVDVPLQAEQARELGIEATLLGSETWDSKGYHARGEFEGSYFVSEWHADATNEEARTFVRFYEERYGRPPASLAALTYDAFGLLFQAMEAQGSVEGGPVRQALASILEYQGVISSISFSGRREPLKDLLLVVRIHGGKALLHRRIAL